MFWEDIVDRELMNDHVRQRQRRMPSSTGQDSAYRLEDVRSYVCQRTYSRPLAIYLPMHRLTFREVKAHAIYYLLELEKQGKVTRDDGYQDILNAIAGDVRSKHRKRMQRQQELSSMQEMLQHLTERKKKYEEQIKSYNSYVEAAMAAMQKSKRSVDDEILKLSSSLNKVCVAARNVSSCPSQSNFITCENFTRPGQRPSMGRTDTALSPYTTRAFSCGSISTRRNGSTISI